MPMSLFFHMNLNIQNSWPHWLSAYCWQFLTDEFRWLPTSSETYSDFVVFFMGSSFKILYQAGFGWVNFLNKSAKSLHIQASPSASTFMKNIFTTTAVWLCMHAANAAIRATFTQSRSRDCNFWVHAIASNLSSIHATSSKALLSLSHKYTS